MAFELADLLGTAVSVGSGGIFGAIASVFGMVGKIFQEKQRQKWEEKKWAHETKMFELNIQKGVAETEAEVKIISSQGAWRGLATSVEAESTIKNVHVWVNDVRTLFRPFLTVIIWILAAMIFFALVNRKLDWLNADEIRLLVRYMVYSIFFGATTALVWWFGDRALTPPQFKNR